MWHREDPSVSWSSHICAACNLCRDLGSRLSELLVSPLQGQGCPGSRGHQHLPCLLYTGLVASQGYDEGSHRCRLWHCSAGAGAGTGSLLELYCKAGMSKLLANHDDWVLPAGVWL